ncbi:COG4280 domain-containing protein, partial [Paenibacillus sp. TAF58]
MEGLYAIFIGFIGTAVEFVEAMTVILAVGMVRGWKYAISGAVAASIVLGLLVGLIGAPLAQIIQISWVQIIVGLCSLLFGIRWLRKAILRYSGLKAIHDEDEAFREELNRLQNVASVKQGFDRFAFMTTFGISMLEGLEAIFIVITFGLSLHAMAFTILGAVIATIIVIAAGFIVRKPLSKVPENTMKYIVGVMLTSFGAFWTGEGFGVIWPHEDASILYISLTLLVFSYVMVKRIKKKLHGME